MMVDSGSPISLIEESVAKAYMARTEKNFSWSQQKEWRYLFCKVNHNFVVVQSLISPVILGIDFLQLCVGLYIHSICIVSKRNKSDMKPLLPTCITPLLNAAKVCATGVSGESEDIIDDCAIPLFGKSAPTCVDIPNLLLLAVLGICSTGRALYSNQWDTSENTSTEDTSTFPSPSRGTNTSHA